MKLLFSEYPAEYDTYTFPYHIWAVQESPKERDDLLKQGFLPTRFKIGLWYLARSSRVDLEQFQESSENRRIVKQTEHFSFHIVPIKTFAQDQHIKSIMARYAEEVIGVSFSLASQKRILSPYLTDHVMVWEDAGTVVGFSPIMDTNKAVFYWYGFYMPEYHRSGLGIRMMLEAIQWAKAQGKQHAYLGTVYSKGALYKTNFAGFEFFNGMQWRSNTEELHYSIHRDQQKPKDDLLQDETWREQFYHASSLTKLLKNL